MNEQDVVLDVRGVAIGEHRVDAVGETGADDGTTTLVNDSVDIFGFWDIVQREEDETVRVCKSIRSERMMWAFLFQEM